MRWIAVIVLTLLASPVWATTYYLAPNGDDSNSGLTSGSPWLTPNHPINCGDVILAAASSSYDASKFGAGRWGAVKCPAGNNVAWLKCTQFDACKIKASNTDGMLVTANYWGVQGWEVTAFGAFAGCFNVQPPTTSGSIHHILLANNVANGCSSNGFTSFNNGDASVDYLAIVGNIAYNAAQGSAFCYSGISVYQPVAADSSAGTHIYIAGNFAWHNVDPNPCNGGLPTDGQGITLDTLTGNGLPTPTAYTQQVVVDNNISIFNGRTGASTSAGGGNSSAHVFLRHNTFYGNNTDNNQSNTWCGELLFDNTRLTQAFYNLAKTSSATACSGNMNYAIYVANGDTSDQIYNNWAFGMGGHHTGMCCSPGVTYPTTNTVGSDPSLVNPVEPGAPSCDGAASVTACMSTVIANFKPSASAALPYGYQVPAAASIYDPLFPQWLCNVNLPPGLITMGCLSQSALPASVTITGVKVQ